MPQASAAAAARAAYRCVTLDRIAATSDRQLFPFQTIEIDYHLLRCWCCFAWWLSSEYVRHVQLFPSPNTNVRLSQSVFSASYFIVPSRAWHPKENQFFVGKFTKNSGETEVGQVKKVQGDTIDEQKRSSLFEKKKPRVTPQNWRLKRSPGFWGKNRGVTPSSQIYLILPTCLQWHCMTRGVARILFWEGINFDQSALSHNDNGFFWKLGQSKYCKYNAPIG